MDAMDSEFWKVPRYVFARKSDFTTDEMVPMTAEEIKDEIEDAVDEADAEDLTVFQVIPTNANITIEKKKIVEIKNFPPV